MTDREFEKTTTGWRAVKFVWVKYVYKHYIREVAIATFFNTLRN